MPNQYPFELSDLNKELEDEIEPGEELNEEDFEEINAEGVPDRPSFPATVFVLAILIDIIKLVSFGFLGMLTAILGFIIIRVYLFGKMSFIKRYVYKKFIAAAVKNVIPIVGAFLGSWTWFILRAHSKNYKRIDQIITAVEKLIRR